MVSSTRKPRRERETFREDGPGNSTIVARRRTGEGAAEFARRCAGKVRRAKYRAVLAAYRRAEYDARRASRTVERLVRSSAEAR